MTQTHRRGYLYAAIGLGLIALTLPPSAAQEAAPSGPPVVDVFPSAPVPGVAPAASNVLTTLFRFPGGANGYSPRSGMVMDSAGILYGTTQYDGLCSTCGLIFKLTPPAKGKTAWTFAAMHKFKLYSDGIHPTGPLTLFKNVIYGTTSAGGDPSCGCGTVFKITRDGTYTRLHTFTPMAKGSTPIAGLLIDTDGTMYGTTDAGGAHGSGVIYKLTQGGGYTILHQFAGDYNGGPQGEMIFGKDGAIYGTQYGGGAYNQGVIFRMTKGGSYKVLYNFKGVNQPGNSHDGANPEGRLALGPDGTIYGTTSFGGSPSGYGTAWSLKWNGSTATYKQLYIFGSPGNLPHSGFIRTGDGKLYGTGAGGGAYQEGVIYRLVPPVAPSTKWTYERLHSFIGRNANGNIPYGDLLYAKQIFYGGNLAGGHITNGGECVSGCGTVFQFKP